MSSQITYIPSILSENGAHVLRQHSFTRWMSPDLLQATTDFCKNISLLPIYAECASEHRTRYLLWHPPDGTRYEVRSGRDKARFEALDKINAERDWQLLSLHINEQSLHSAVWISADHYDIAVTILKSYGILPAQRLKA